MGQPEYDKTEKPLTEQLVAMGWAHLQGGPPGETATDPAASGRESFHQVLYADRFRAAVSRINPGADGEPWLSAAQLDWLCALVRGVVPGHGPGKHGVAGNLELTRLLRDGVNARRVPGRTKSDPEHVRLVDWDGEFAPGNDLLAVSQFRVDREGRQPATPDMVLFVNGLPWAVVECKAPLTSGADSRAALDFAVEQVLGYAGAEYVSAVPEFVRFAQVLIGTDRDHAELGTVSAEPRHFAPWRTVRPIGEDVVRQEVGKEAEKGHVPLTDQEVLVAGVLRPAHLLTLVRDFSTQKGIGARTVKVIGRYQQFRAVLEIARRLDVRRRAVAKGEPVDQRGGVVWHTQGSGKSLTMAFLVRHLRSTKELSGHKVVVVTDRLDLEKQIRESLGASDEKVHRATSVKRARKYLAVDVPDLVLVTLQKARRDDTAYDGTEESLGEGEGEGQEEAHLHNRVANGDSDIVVLIDEAHRGQSRWQHARLRAMLPNAAMVGFTGTPIISGAAKTTEQIFGGFADTYTLRDAERDRSVVPVRYEAYDVPLEVIEKAALDAKFEEHVPEDPERRERVLRTFARRKEILEAPSVIAEKADHMLRHWARNALPDRFGAQLVAVSRLAAVRYRDALIDARDRLLDRIDALDPELIHDPMAVHSATEVERELLDLLPHRAVLASIDAAVVISKAENGTVQPDGSRRQDPEAWQRWTLKSKQDAYIARFKKGIGDPLAAAADPSWRAETHGGAGLGQGAPAGSGEIWDEWSAAGSGAADPARESMDAGAGEQREGKGSDGPMAFLVVQSMLLTGFDAPVEQVLYLDCALSGVGLLQAVARTNRPYPAKEWGLVVDFIGIGPELAGSLDKYDQAHLRHVYGFDAVSVDHLKPDYEGRQPTGDELLVQADVAAEALLADLSGKVSTFLDRYGIPSLAELADEVRQEDLLQALSDPLLLGEFDELVRDFLTALNAVLPRPKALEYEDLAGRLGELQHIARRRYLDGRDQFSPRRYGAKVRQLISRHLKVTGIEQRIPPVDLSAPDFMRRVNANKDPRARTAYMAGSLRLRITARIASNRARYGTFSERLEEVVQQMRQDFEKAAVDLAVLVGDVNAAERSGPDDNGLDPRTEGAVYGLLRKELEEAGAAPSPPGVDLFQASRVLTVEIAGFVRTPDIETLADTQNRVRKLLRRCLAQHAGMDWALTGPLASRLVELAVASRDEFLRYGAQRDR
ncbi:type I restriction endonuclease subunit R [Streptomyces violascens]|uniref:type I restriction endonuclease subunit R n=1 Tax=Streptomyces violascens TaxID=67381 RepID=UPI00365C3BBE